jgi:prepilin-type processing-associated H-X9-DG protein
MGKNILPRLRRAEGAKMFATPVSAFVCPSRRSAQPWPFIRALVNISPPNTAGRSDYAANIGNRQPTDQRAPGPPSYRVASTWQEGDNRLKNWVATKHNGVVFQRSTVTPGMITNGLSKTFFAGEKFLSTNHYEDGEAYGDDQSLYVGFDRDNARSTNELHPPMRDAKIESNWYGEGDDASVVDWNFGSAHPGACNMLFCDGAVIPVDYEVDMRIFSAQGSRSPD